MVTFANTNSLCDFYKNIITIVHYGNNIFDSSLYITLQIKVVSVRISIVKLYSGEFGKPLYGDKHRRTGHQEEELG